MITFDDFKKVEMKVGKILSAERVEKSDKLLKLSVDFGELKTEGPNPPANNEEGEVTQRAQSLDTSEQQRVSRRDIRQVVSGIGKYFENLEQLVGSQYTFVTNLEPRPIMGLVSEAMIIAVSTPEAIAFFDAPEVIPPGTLAK
jgi:tRNA-binding EMAP/Myf-like protein